MKDRNLPHSDNWATPEYIYKPLNEKYGFDFDPCPLKHDLSVFDGLSVIWGERNFVNPPYSIELKTKFIHKAVEEAKKGKLCVLLLPVSTSTKLFHEVLKVYATEPIHFFKGRIKFIGHNTLGELVSNKSPMHDSMLVGMDGTLL